MFQTATVLADEAQATPTGPILRAPQVCDITGVTYRQLDYWVRCGVVEPAVPASGSGSQRGFTLHQVAVLRCLGQLAAAGAGSQQLRGAWKYLSALSLQDWHDKVYVSPGGYVGRKLMGPVAIALNLERTRADMLVATLGGVAVSEGDG